MVAMDQGNTLLPDLAMVAKPSEGKDTPPAYVSGILERLRDVHRWVAPTEVPTWTNLYQPEDLIWVSTPPLEKTSKLLSRWIGPFQVSKVPNPYLATYSSDRGLWAVHIHHVKPALLDLLTKTLVPEDETLQPSLIGYLSSAHTQESTNRSKARKTANNSLSQPSQPPSTPGGLEANPSVGHSSSVSPANRNAVAQGSVNSPGLYKPPRMVMRTRYGQKVRPADRLQAIDAHCAVPLPLSILGVPGPSLSPSTFSAILFAREDRAVWILKRSRDLPKIQKWMQGHASVQLSGHQQPGCQPLLPLAYKSLLAILPEGVVWL